MTVDAYAPGSVTALFSPPPKGSEQPSYGASIAIDDGVGVGLESAPDTRVYVEDDPVEFEPVTGVLERLNTTARVDVTADVPIGAGFGASGAATLATAVAANERFDLGHEFDTLLDAAYKAEVAAGTGMGDVFIQAEGGLVMNVGDGVTRFERDDPIEYRSIGGMATNEILNDEATIDRITEVGREQISQLSSDPPVREVIERGWTFAQRTGLVTEWIESEVATIEAAGGAGTMAMFGQTVFAVDVTDVLDHRTAIDTTGVRLC
ncbi:MAG: GHMP kinase [Halobacteriales archaeon]|nr:GHMP kinase [Halobacteriales archaeon]